MIKQISTKMSAPASGTMYVASVITTYWVVSISMVYLNKMLLSNEQASIAAPLFVTWFQCVLTCIICIILGNMGERTRARGTASFLNDFSKVKYNLTSGTLNLLVNRKFFAVIYYENVPWTIEFY